MSSAAVGTCSGAFSGVGAGGAGGGVWGVGAVCANATEATKTHIHLIDVLIGERPAEL
jgi:hypothetical protein